jgi:16S rRNA (guanine527-N7)-methyltransferase
VNHDPGALPLAVLARAQELGFLGPGPVEAQRAHAEGFGEVVEGTLDAAPESLVDLGSGGGLPGLVLTARWPGCRVALVESNHRRCELLRAVVAEQGWAERVEVVEARAEVVGHESGRREGFRVATARGLAGPAATAEIAAGFVVVGGVLVVSEPPEPESERWPPAGLAVFGFGPAVRSTVRSGSFVAIRKISSTPEDVPRGVGRPSKRPRW